MLHLLASSEGDVDLLELVKTSQDTGPSHSSENVGSGSLHQRHEALVLQHLKTFELQHEGLLSRCALLVYY